MVEVESAEDIARLKRERTAAKSAVTRAINKLKSFQLSEELTHFLTSYRDTLAKFEALKDGNNQMCEKDPSNSEIYFEYEDKVNDEYINTLLSLKTWYDVHSYNVSATSKKGITLNTHHARVNLKGYYHNSWHLRDYL